MKKKVSIVFGTRPEAIKLCPIILEFRKYPEFEPRVCVTAQHREMLDQVLEVFSVEPDTDLNLMEENQSLASLTSRSIAELDSYYKKEKPDLVIVQGDTTTTFVASLAAFYNKIPIGHVEAGLVDGSKIFVDSSLVDADASNNSVIDTQSLKIHLRENYKKLEARLEEARESSDSSRRYVKKNSRYMSTTDPDAAIVNRGRSKLSYQVHRAVDVRSEVITATETTAGDVNEAHVMVPLLESYQVNTGRGAETVVADSKYGTIDNFLACHDRGLKAHMPDLRGASVKRTEKLKIFSEERFEYDLESDTYRCPAGNVLKPKSLHFNRQSRDYAAPQKTCEACHLREQCTKNKSGRTIKRHLRQEELDKMREASRSAKARRDIKTRQHLMERSFARGGRYGYDQARWRGLWRVQIQEYLIAAVQNLEVLFRYGAQPQRGLAFKVDQVKGALTQAIGPVIDRVKEFFSPDLNRTLVTRFVSFGYIKSGSLRFLIL